MPSARALAENAAKTVPTSGHAQAKFHSVPFTDKTHSRVHQTIFWKIGFTFHLLLLFPAGIQRHVSLLCLLVDMMLDTGEDILCVLEVCQFVTRTFFSSGCFSNWFSVPHGACGVRRNEVGRCAQCVVRGSRKIVPPILLCLGALHFVLLWQEWFFPMQPSLEREDFLRVEYFAVIR